MRHTRSLVGPEPDPSNTTSVPLVTAPPSWNTACGNLPSTLAGARYAGAAVLVQRGGCKFVEKAMNVQKLGAALLERGGVDDGLERAEADPRLDDARCDRGGAA